MILIYTDGSCSGNGKKNNSGGYGVVVLESWDGVVETANPIEFRSKRAVNDTTNNREELKAILYTMLKYGKQESDYANIPVVHSDSAYAVNTLTNWMFGWSRNGWVKSDKKIPENLDLIKAFYDHYQKGYRITLKKVPGHSGVLWNEVADRLATAQLDEGKAYSLYGGKSQLIRRL